MHTAYIAHFWIWIDPIYMVIKLKLNADYLRPTDGSELDRSAVLSMEYIKMTSTDCFESGINSMDWSG
jgi:hypothetical protein